MASLKVSQKSLTKYSTLYRWNGHFGHLSEIIKNQNYQFGTFWINNQRFFIETILYKRSTIFCPFCACAREQQRKLERRDLICLFRI